MNKMKSRKLWLALVLMGIFTFLMYMEKIDASNYTEAMLTLFGIYSGANVLTKYVSQKKE